jgi:hypothetical protein
MASGELSCRTSRNLLDLPIEIRTDIFKWVLASSGKIVLRSPYVPNHKHIGEEEWNAVISHSMKLSPSPRSPQLLRASRQVSQEGSFVLYGCNVFVLTGLCLDGDDPSPFLISNFGIKNVALIRHIVMGRPPHARNLTSLGALQTLELRLHRNPDGFSQFEAATLPPQDVGAWIMEKQLFSLRIDDLIQTQQSLTINLCIAAEKRPFFCTYRGCNSPWFASRSDMFQHQQNVHRLPGHAENPYLCDFPDCERRQQGNGFPHRRNAIDHMRRVHGLSGFREHNLTSRQADSRPSFISRPMPR